MIKKKIIASCLKQIIEIQESENMEDGAGGFISSWNTKKILPACVSTLRENSNFIKGEIYNAYQIISSNYYEVIIRFRKDITNKMRIKYKNKILSIKKVINHQEADQYLILLTQEGDNA